MACSARSEQPARKGLLLVVWAFAVEGLEPMCDACKRAASLETEQQSACREQSNGPDGIINE